MLLGWWENEGRYIG